MQKLKINIQKIDPNAQLPTYGTEFSAGADLHALLDAGLTILPGETKFVKTGLAFEIPEGYVGLLFARSGLACKQGLALANKVGVIDSDYRGELMVALHNHSSQPCTVANGDRIAQLVIMPYFCAEFEEVERLNESVRSAGAFGSTGCK